MPFGIVRGADCPLQRGVSARLTERIQLRFRNVLEPAAFELRGLLERNVGLVAVGVDARQVGIAPGGPCRLPVLRHVDSGEQVRVALLEPRGDVLNELSLGFLDGLHVAGRRL